MQSNVLAAFGLAIALTACKAPQSADLLLRGGTVYIGDKTDGEIGHVAIKGDEIIYVGKKASHIKANQTIDVTGMIVTPGFIDPHTHSMGELGSDKPSLRRNDNYRFQGVTTVFNGNDGYGDPDISGMTEAFTRTGIGTNTAFFVGHGAVRYTVMKNAKREPTLDELAEMEALVDKGMEAGALGLSTGLFYAPGSFAKTSEVIALAKVAGRHGGIYDSHVRDESTYNIGLKAAIDEVLEIGRAANIPVHVAHIKALGVDVWGQSEAIIDTINAARADGMAVTADQYPWPASGTRISNALLPRWVKAGTDEEYMKRLDDMTIRDGLLAEIAENMRRRGGADAVLITQDRNGWLGRTLGQIAGEAGLTPAEMAISISRDGDARIASFNMNSDDIDNFMRQDWVMTSSDGSTGHPRKFASFPRKYETYVKEKGVLSLTDFIHRSTGLTADTFRLCDRGYLKAGLKADITVFDPEGFRQVADFHIPKELSDGVEYLVINGELAVKEGVSQAVMPGTVVKPCQLKPEN